MKIRLLIVMVMRKMILRWTLAAKNDNYHIHYSMQQHGPLGGGGRSGALSVTLRAALKVIVFVFVFVLSEVFSVSSRAILNV